MNTMTHTNRRAAAGTLIVRASSVAVVLATSDGPQRVGHGDQATANRTAARLSIPGAAGANLWFAAP